MVFSSTAIATCAIHTACMSKDHDSCWTAQAQDCPFEILGTKEVQTGGMAQVEGVAECATYHSLES